MRVETVVHPAFIYMKRIYETKRLVIVHEKQPAPGLENRKQLHVEVSDFLTFAFLICSAGLQVRLQSRFALIEISPRGNSAET